MIRAVCEVSVYMKEFDTPFDVLVLAPFVLTAHLDTDRDILAIFSLKERENYYFRWAHVLAVQVSETREEDIE